MPVNGRIEPSSDGLDAARERAELQALNSLLSLVTGVAPARPLDNR